MTIPDHKRRVTMALDVAVADDLAETARECKVRVSTIVTAALGLMPAEKKTRIEIEGLAWRHEADLWSPCDSDGEEAKK